MRHEYILKRDNGDKVQIDIAANMDRFREDGIRFTVSVYIMPKGKRKWLSVVDHNDFKWRKLSSEERYKDDINTQLQYVTPDEILSAKLELWQKLKPEN